MRRKDPLRILEAIYSFDSDESTWMHGIVDAAEPYDLGSGVGGYVVSLGRDLRVRSAAASGLSRYDDAAIDRLGKWGHVTPALFRRCHAPQRFCDNRDSMLQAARVTRTPLSLLEPTLRPQDPSFPRVCGVIGGDAAWETATLWLAMSEGRSPSNSDRTAFDLLGAHLGAALRLRSLVRTPTADAASTEAVFSSEGQVLDARGDQSKRALPLLIDAVRRSERARTRRSDRLEALSLWTALVDGRWSVVETVERDGKRMILACRNEPRTARIRCLNTRERSVAEYAALGHSYKYIAYELGISLPAVSLSVQNVLRKLGLKSRADLIATLGRSPRRRPTCD